MSFFRETTVGQIVRVVTGRRFLKYPEEEPGFQVPVEYATLSSASSIVNSSSIANEKDDRTSTSGDLEAAVDAEPTPATKGVTTVTWYSKTDAENPHNWSSGRKAWVSTFLFMYTFSGYIGSSLYTASVPGIMDEFHVTEIVASLGLTLYVLAYGIAPLILSPLSEIPAIGRNPPYAGSFVIFMLFTIPIPLMNNLGGILFFRFMLGFLCSPALTTVGASYGDFVSPQNMQYVFAFWGGGATLAPSLGPLVGSYAVEAKGWRWSGWELLWLAGPMCLLMLFTLPETSADRILLGRARRLRALTGRTDLKADGEIRQKEMNARAIAFDALIKPWEINALDPAVLFTTVYMALTYGIFYSFFESFPMVFRDIYNFSLGSVGLAFLCVLVGLIVSVIFLCGYLYFIAPKRFAKMEVIPPEERIWPGLWATFLIPVGLFIFAWTAREPIHWVVCMIGVAISICGIITITQAVLIYLPFVYPRYAGSLFAANGLARSIFAAAAILFSPPMFRAIGISGGVSLLAGCSVICSFGVFGLYFWGANLRRRSKFAVS